ncbi:hypothetical protein [Oryzicola mucosus]|uniref:Uncharacterized protein n=1 Tax=Oryzicola mucosus TaxID=2767425 RepID=A0A8J6PZV5_9HYPH|nr:hypothetical protein [Oryzicola mucosus]MBD0417482.1 hypothetical protein [Oryzicola mucosus]
MFAKNQHIEDARALRDIYVLERRKKIAAALDRHRANGEGGLFGGEVKTFQEIIEALDRVIRDEGALQQAGYPVDNL